MEYLNSVDVWDILNFGSLGYQIPSILFLWLFDVNMILMSRTIAEWPISGPSKQGSLNTFDGENNYIFEIKLSLKLEKK